MPSYKTNKRNQCLILLNYFKNRKENPLMPKKKKRKPKKAHFSLINILQLFIV